MSRSITRFGRTGYITRTDGVCYQVKVSEDGMSVTERKRVQDGFPFYSPNCKRTDSFMGGIGNDSWPTSRAGWEVIQASPGTDADGRHNAYILRDRFYGGEYWIATRNGDTYEAVNVGPQMPAPFLEDADIPTHEPIRQLSDPGTDWFIIGLYGLGTLAGVALIYFTGKILKLY
jgi:hypothetical protein